MSNRASNLQSEHILIAARNTCSLSSRAIGLSEPAYDPSTKLLWWEGYCFLQRRFTQVGDPRLGHAKFILLVTRYTRPYTRSREWRGLSLASSLSVLSSALPPFHLLLALLFPHWYLTEIQDGRSVCFHLLFLMPRNLLINAALKITESWKQKISNSSRQWGWRLRQWAASLGSHKVTSFSYCTFQHCRFSAY